MGRSEMAALVSQFISFVGQSFASGSGDNLINAIPLDATHTFYAPLKQALANFPNSAIKLSNVIAPLQVVPQDAQEPLAAFLVAVLRNIKGNDAGADGEASIAYADFRAMVVMHNEVNKLYGLTNTDGGYAYPFLNPLILITSRHLIRLSHSAANLSEFPIRHPRSARSISSSNMTDLEWKGEISREFSVSDNVWPLANSLWRIYAERNLHTQSTELQKSINAMIPSESKRLAARGTFVPSTAIVESYYWRGKLGVVLLDMRNARFWLEKAWELCPATALRQRRAILIRLVPVSLLLGRLPTRNVLQQFHLYDEFYPLLHAFRTGNIPAWRNILDQKRNWFRRRSIWLILFERGEILVWRNLLRNCLKMYYQINETAPKNRCPTRVFLDATRNMFNGSGELEDGKVELEDLICVIASLIDQGLILGNLSYSQGFLVMRPSEDGMGGFPRISQVAPRRVEAIS